MKKLKALYEAHQEIISYLFFGAATTITPGNILSWLVAVIFAFITNKLWVFQSKSWAWPLWLKEAAAFFAGRIFSGLVELFGLPLLMKLGLDQSIFGIEGFAAKLVVTVVVIILNYILSKFIAFRKKV